MKTIFFLACCLLFQAGAYAKDIDVNKKVLLSFNRTFTHAQGLKWYEGANQFTAVFTQADASFRVQFDSKGNIISSLKYYQPWLLPVSISTEIRNQFPRQTPFGVTEVTVGNEMAYVIKMFDNDYWYTLRVSPQGELEVMEQFLRADKNL